MREILFRGKKCNGEWVHGYYVQANNSWHDYGKHKEWIVCSACANGGWFALQEKHAVIPETVGQYTGLKDKNGKKIFEGDAVWFSDEKERGVVYFDNSCARFAVRFDTFDAAFDHLYSNELEIIGNVFDNPELMEGGE